MKKIIALFVLFILTTDIHAQTDTAKKPNARQTADGNFVSIKKEPAKGTPTGQTILHTDSVKYEVFKSAKGKLYYIVTNKKGNPSKRYINL